MRELKLSEGQIKVACRRMSSVFRGVYATRGLDSLGWFRAATLALGPHAVLSHVSAAMLMDLRPYRPDEIHVSVPGNGGRAKRDGIVVHRRRAMEVGDCQGIPCTSPTQALREANLAPFELYRALEAAERHGYSTSLPLNDVVRLRRQVRGRTRSDAEAAALILMHQHGITLPLVNHRLNGIEADFHWPEARLVLEVDGWEYHKERPQFEEDRRRGLVHSAAGYQVVRASARHVMSEPELVLGALQTTGW